MVGLLGADAYINAQLDGLPAPGSAPVLARSTVIYDRNGRVLAERNDQGSYHVVLRLDQMGTVAPAATLAAEDRDFYRHGALDGFGIMRALAVDAVNQQPLQGGSTITQQLVKIETGQPEKTFSRKLREALLANAMERRYSKDQILELYLNRVYYGHGAYGIGAATKTYFGADRQVTDLTPAQAAFLAGLLTAPSTNDPQAHYDLARARELDVLGGMVATGALTQAQADAAAAEDVQAALRFDRSYAQTVAPHFVDYVLSRLESMFGAAAVQQGGFAVRTTLDSDLQAKAETAVRDGVARLSGSGVNNGMLLAARPSTGEVLAWVGSADYANQEIGGQFDVVLSPRQPGSSFKPYVFEAALKDHTITLASCLQDRATSFDGYRPQDFDNRYMGPLTARQSLLLSRNIPAVQVASAEGIGKVIDLAATMGIRGDLQPNLSTAIGGSEVTMFDHLQGYQVFANQGRKVPLMSITSITDGTGAVLFQADPGKQEGQQQVLASEEAYLVTDVLKGYQSEWNLGWQRQMAGKSGTSGGGATGIRDAWMMAYNPDVVVGAWAGNTAAGGGKPINTYGVNTGQSMLASFINGLPADWNHWYPQPSGLVSSRGELFLSGTERTTACGREQPSDQPGDNANTSEPPKTKKRRRD
ncbi:MAG: hypothetical protein QOE92_805 [Chloroflexota bacterium]|nr:hypothetical protein [Chloroflexota bacterium]